MQVRYEIVSDKFDKIPGSPIAYWVSESWFKAFDKYPVLREYATMKKGTSTGDNARFIRNWQEVSFDKTCISATSPESAEKSLKKWFPINSGGEYRKWYGNRNEVVNWYKDGLEMKALATKLNHGGHWSRYIVSPDRFFTNNIAWSAISSSKISVRQSGYGFAFSSASMEAFGDNLLYIMALVNSVVADDILKLLAPTINFGVEQVGKIPIIVEQQETIKGLVDENINLSRSDWDSYETSWDFKKHPLI